MIGCRTVPDDELCYVYATGETASNANMLFNDNWTLFHQTELGGGNGDLRDGFLLGLGAVDKEHLWSTYIGGALTDKAWGVDQLGH